jgi:uncharacterized membrane protein
VTGSTNVNSAGMAIPTLAYDRPSASAMHRSLDVATPAATAFARICEVENWPVWLSFLRSSRLVDPDAQLCAGSEIAIRSQIPGEDEELFEVDRFIPGHQMSLVGVFSCRRRIDLRVEQKSDRCKIVVRLDYPTYGGALATLLDRLTRRRRLEGALANSLVHFKGLVEFEPRGGVLEDF